MHDPAGVGVGERRRDLHEDPHGIRGGEGAVLPHALAHRFSFHVSHRVKNESRGFVDGEDWYDVRVHQLRRDAGFAEEARAPVGVGGAGGGEDLDGHRPVEPQVAGQEHEAVAAALEESLEIIPPGQGGADRLGGRVGIRRHHHPELERAARAAAAAGTPRGGGRVPCRGTEFRTGC